MIKVLHRSFLLFLSMLLVSVMRPEGVVEGTLVHTAQGYLYIQDLLVGDELLVYDFDSGNIISEKILQIESHEVDRIIVLDVGSDIIGVEQDQLVYEPLQRRWMTADQFEVGHNVFTAELCKPVLDVIAQHKQTVRVYTISLAHHHNYLVGKQGILIHNFDAILTCAAAESGFFTAFLAANPVAAPVIIGIGGAGLFSYFLWKFFNPNPHRPARPSNGGKPGESRNPNGDNDHKALEATGKLLAFLKSLEEHKEKAAKVFDRTYEWLQTSTGFKTIEHCFRQNCAHNFERIFERMGGGTDANRLKFIADVTQKLIDKGSKLVVDANGVFEKVLVEYEGELITVQGRIIDEMFKISTMFIQPQHVR